MENASKALIIAGAILLAILIIGLGIFIYNQASNTVGETGMDQVAIRQFNGQFEPYINKTIDSTAAKALINTVEQSNHLGKNRIKLPSIADKSEIKTGHKYTIEVRYSEGVISAIEINDADGSSGDDNGIIPGLVDIRPESFNQQFAGYTPLTIDADSPQAITSAQIEELSRLVSKSNEKYSEHQIILDLPSFTGSGYGAYSHFDAKGYIDGIIIDVTAK